MKINEFDRIASKYLANYEIRLSQLYRPNIMQQLINHFFLEKIENEDSETIRKFANNFCNDKELFEA